MSLTPRIDTIEQSAAIRGFTPNFIINGNFDIWQRGTSVVPSGSVYLADRFRLFFDSPLC